MSFVSLGVDGSSFSNAGSPTSSPSALIAKSGSTCRSTPKPLHDRTVFLTDGPEDLVVVQGAVDVTFAQGMRLCMEETGGELFIPTTLWER